MPFRANFRIADDWIGWQTGRSTAAFLASYYEIELANRE